MLESVWQKSSFSGNVENCVEVRTTHGAIELRESDEGDIILRTTAARLSVLLIAIKAGELR
ncbi:DUF397 domain-containing protein [Kitasatospora sp. NPDC093558]|uniref:DUF397 domain-containing protein n=1 Tax=Kitasatospora sp. NPDC093558 TaxID=3155201 RepID=UPI00342A2203